MKRPSSHLTARHHARMRVAAAAATPPWPTAPDEPCPARRAALRLALAAAAGAA